MKFDDDAMSSEPTLYTIAAWLVGVSLVKGTAGITSGGLRGKAYLSGNGCAFQAIPLRVVEDSGSSGV